MARAGLRHTQTNYSLEYAGKDADKAHWLQFVNRTMYANEPGTGRVYHTGSVRTSSGKTKSTKIPWPSCSRIRRHFAASMRQPDSEVTAGPGELEAKPVR